MIFRRCLSKPVLRRFCTKPANLLHDWYQQDHIKIDSIAINGTTKIIGLPWDIGMTEQWSGKVNQVMEAEFNQNNTSTIVVQSDYAPNIGINRLFGLRALEADVYKGITKPSVEILNQNPDLPISVQQLILVDQIFFDPEQKCKTTEEYQKEAEEISNDLERLSNRLTDPYKIDDRMQLFAGPALITGRDLAVAGISELLIRRAIATSVSLATLKTAFVSCVSSMRGMKDTHGYCKDYLHEMFSELLVPLENYMIYLVLSKLKRPTTLICNAYCIPGIKALKQKETLDDSVKIGKFDNFNSFFSIQRNVATAEDNDQIMIEKHALLQGLLENQLWQEPYVKNMFPYLSEDYKALSEVEQNTIKDRYKYHLNRYLSAKNKLLNASV